MAVAHEPAGGDGCIPALRAARPGRDGLCDNGFSVISADGRRWDGRDPGTGRDGDRDHRRRAHPRRRSRCVPRRAPPGHHRPHLHPYPGAAGPASSAGTGPWPASPAATWTTRPAGCGAASHRAPGTGTWPHRLVPGLVPPPRLARREPGAARRPPRRGRGRHPGDPLPELERLWARAESRCGNGRCGGCCTTPPPARGKPSAWTSPTLTLLTGRPGPAPRAATSGRCTSRPPPPGCWPGWPPDASPGRCSSPPAGPPRTG